MFQAGTDLAIRDAIQRPNATPAAAPGTFAGFWRFGGGVPAGALDAGASLSDIAGGVGQISQGLGLRPANNSGLLTADDVDAANAQRDAARDSKVNWTSPWSGTLRTEAKSFMPDPNTTGAATQIAAGVTHFMTEAVPLMAAGGPMGPAAIGGVAGVDEAQKLKDEGVDEATRTKAATVAGIGAGVSMILPMTGATRLIRAGKGAAGGVGATAAQTEGERLILQQDPAYAKLANQYDPLDPTALALSALVPAGFGAAFGHAKPGGKLAEPGPADFAFTPAEQAHSDAMEAASIDTDIASLHAELAKQPDAGARAVLQTELERLTRQKQLGAATAAATDPNVVAAARTLLTADAMEASRLTADGDLAGRDIHVNAVETAADQIARGEDVQVGSIEPQLLAHDVFPVDPTFVLDDHTGLNPQDRAYTMNTVDAVREAQALIGPDRFQELAEQRITPEAQARWDASQAAQIEMAARRVVDFYDRNPGAAARAIELNSRPAALARAVGEMRAGREPVDAGGDLARRAPGADLAPGAGGGDLRDLRPSPTHERLEEDTNPEQAHLDAASDEIARATPDMLVHLEGMDAPMRVGDLLEYMRAAAAEEGRGARLVEVAAQCFLRN